jgi:YVTN family beta-propeller protein
MFTKTRALATALAGLLLSTAVLLPAQTLITDVSVGSFPVAVAVNASSNKIYVVNQSGNSVTVIDGVTDLTTTVATGSYPMALAVNSVTNQIYVVNGNDNSMTVIDGASNRTITVSAGAAPVAIAVNAVTNRIYVANFYSSSVTIIEGTTYATTSVNVGPHPCSLSVNSSTNKIYVANYSGGTVSAIDGATGAVTPIAVGTGPRAVAVDQITNQIYVANFESSSVSVIDGATYAVTPVNVGLYPVALAVDPVLNLIYVANSGDDTATVINGMTQATTTVTVGNWPAAVDVDSVTGKAYFAIPGTPGSVTMLDGIDDSTVSVLIGPYPEAIAVDAIHNRIYTANQGDNSASILAGASAHPLQFIPVSPCRLVDTRLTPGTFGGPPIAAGTSRSFPLPQQPYCNIPTTALAYSLNVTVVPQGTLGYLTIWPTGVSQPVVSTLNSLDGRVKANAAIVPAGAAGAISVFVSDTTNVILDINGYFEPAGPQTLQFYPVSPCRVFDTRNQTGDLGGPHLHGTRERDFPVQESGCQIPGSALAYSINFTVVPWQGTPLGYLTVWAAGNNQPLVSTLNNPTATVVANAAIVPAGVDGAIAVYPDQNTDLVGDIDGYFAAPSPGGLSLYPTAPCRVLDTRSNGGAFSGQRNPPVNVTASPCSIPATAGGYVFNVTAVPLGMLGYLTLWPDGQSMPLASTLNALDGIITSNMTILLNQDGQVDAYASGLTQMILDISSYFAP